MHLKGLTSEVECVSNRLQLAASRVEEAAQAVPCTEVLAREASSSSVRLM